MEFIKKGERDESVLLEVPDGSRGWFGFLEMAAVGGREYAALTDQAGEITVLRFYEAAGGRPERYETEEDPAAFDAACAALEALLNGEED